MLTPQEQREECAPDPAALGESPGTHASEKPAPTGDRLYESMYTAF